MWKDVKPRPELKAKLMYPLTLVEAWQKMEDFHARGLVRSIGLSNFPAEEIEELSRVWKVKPSVKQVSLKISQSCSTRACTYFKDRTPRVH